MNPKKVTLAVNKTYCKSCGICYSLCPREALAADHEGKAEFAYPERCIGCKLCEYRCPDFAIRVEVE